MPPWQLKEQTPSQDSDPTPHLSPATPPPDPRPDVMARPAFVPTEFGNPPPSEIYGDATPSQASPTDSSYDPDLQDAIMADAQMQAEEKGDISRAQLLAEERNRAAAAQKDP